jgi:hypothetical protein
LFKFNLYRYRTFVTLAVLSLLAAVDKYSKDSLGGALQVDSS